MNITHPVWSRSKKTFVLVFNVERGLSIFIRLPNNRAIIYDLGCSETFSPSNFIKEHIISYITYIDQLIVSHPHKDHYQEAEKMLEMLAHADKPIQLITMPHFEIGYDEALNEKRLMAMKADDKSLYRSIYGVRKPPLQTIDYHKNKTLLINSADIECGIFYMRPPKVEEQHPTSDQDYGNGTSICFYLRHDKHAIWIPGDVTPNVLPHILEKSNAVERRFSILGEKASCSWGQKKSSPTTTISDNPLPTELLSRRDISLINITPHHGLESSYVDTLFNIVTPLINIASERAETTGKCSKCYSEKASGAHILQGNPIVQAEGKRKFLTTRNDGHIAMILGCDSPSPKIYCSKNPNDLMDFINKFS